MCDGGLPTNDAQMDSSRIPIDFKGSCCEAPRQADNNRFNTAHTAQSYFEED